jgi:RNA polymerase sigma factor (sigma-70 family)
MIAVRRYEPSKGAAFSTYAYYWIQKHLHGCLDDFRKNSCGMPLELDAQGREAISNDDVESDFFSSPPTPGDEPSQREQDLHLVLTASLEKLPELQRKVIRLRYLPDGEGRRLTQMEVARKLGLSTRHVKRIQAEALERLREDPVLELFMQPEVEDCRRAVVKKNTAAPPDESKAFPGVKTWMALNSPMRK